MPKSGVTLYAFLGCPPTIAVKEMGIKRSRKRMKTIKAIVIDDDPSVLIYLRQILQRRGYEVHTYDDPVESPLYKSSGCPCSMREAGCPDLIVSDFNMPVVNGVELLESAIEKGCHCRHLALMSAKGLMEADMRRLAKYGTRYFTKPLDLDDFYPWLDKVEKEIAERPSV